MKLTIEEYGMLMKAVLDKEDAMLHDSEVCREQGRYFKSDYYADRYRVCKNLYNKLADMMDDITE